MFRSSLTSLRTGGTQQPFPLLPWPCSYPRIARSIGGQHCCNRVAADFRRKPRWGRQTRREVRAWRICRLDLGRLQWSLAQLASVQQLVSRQRKEFDEII